MRGLRPPDSAWFSGKALQTPHLKPTDPGRAAANPGGSHPVAEPSGTDASAALCLLSSAGGPLMPRARGLFAAWPVGTAFQEAPTYLRLQVHLLALKDE